MKKGRACRARKPQNRHGMSNSIHVVSVSAHPHDRSLWVFDDERSGLREEPFVLGGERSD